MSILTGLLRSQDVLLASDTLGASASEEYADRHVSKMYTVPHLHTVFATIGHIGMPIHLLTRLQMVDLESYDFDGLVPVLPESLDLAYGKTAELIYSQGIADQYRMLGVKVMLFGYSRSMNRIRGLFFERGSMNDEFRVVEVPPGYFAQPGTLPTDLERIQQMMARKPNPEKILIEFAKAQRVAIEAEYAGAGIVGNDAKIGGRLMLTRLSRDRIEQRQIWAWPDADRLRPAGAPVANIEALTP